MSPASHLYNKTNVGLSDADYTEQDITSGSSRFSRRNTWCA